MDTEFLVKGLVSFIAIPKNDIVKQGRSGLCIGSCSNTRLNNVSCALGLMPI